MSRQGDHEVREGQFALAGSLCAPIDSSFQHTGAGEEVSADEPTFRSVRHEIHSSDTRTRAMGAPPSSSDLPPLSDLKSELLHTTAPAQLAQDLYALQISENMTKRFRDLGDSPGAGQDDTPTSSPDAIPSPPVEDEDRRKRQRILHHISAQTSVDPCDQLRSDQLAFIPRAYQLELAELAKSGNVLVCLDTGSGKTLISVLLLQHVHQQSVERPFSPPESHASASRSRKVSFFLVNLVPLVHQQSSVIAGNSTLSVGKLYGELKDSIRGKNDKLTVDTWREPQWSALLVSHQVIVSTAQCFLDALIHGFIKMDDLNLLIFDEVHHALKNHPFFRIMKYYRLAPDHQRPKIFGMTASPIFTGTGEFDEASRYLQKTMHARIHTVSKETLQSLKEVKQRPEEMVVEYDSYRTVLDDDVDGAQLSDLSLEMIATFGKNPDVDDEEVLDSVTEHFEKEVRPKLEYTMRHLGPLGCDLLWHSTLLEYRSRARKWINIDRDKRTLVSDDWIVDASMRTSTLTPPESQGSSNGDGGSPGSGSQSSGSGSGLGLGLAVAHLSTNSELNQRILLQMRSRPILPNALSLNTNNASPKVLRLIEMLKCFEPSKAEFCGIIFVERRQTATLLVELIKRVPGLEFIHPEFLLGHENGSASGGAPGMDWHDQVQVLNRFRRRKPTNLLVATSIAEEGLDIQAANLVIRFDLFNRHISFLQSRGRARAKESRFIIMAETGNRDHAQAILNAFNTEANRSTWLEGIAENHDAGCWDEEWQHKLRVEADDDDVAGGEVCIYEESTGARLFAEDAPTLISHYAATLHTEYLQDAILAYKMQVADEVISDAKSFNCVLELPSTSAVRRVESGQCRNKKQAKRMAAFKACQQLRELGELDEWLMPKLIDRTEVQKANSAGGKVNPHHKAWRGSGKPIDVPVKKMDGWARFIVSRDAGEEEAKGVYHATYLPLDGFDGSFQPLVLLVRGGALPETKLLKLFHSSGRLKDVRPKSLGAIPSLSKDDVEAATRFTKFIFKLVGRKDIHRANDKSKNLTPRSDDEDGEPAVLILPVRRAAGVTEVHTPSDLESDFPTSLDCIPFDLSESQLRDRVLVRQHGYHSHSLYRFNSIRPDLTPNSPLTSNDTDTYLTQHLRMYGRFHSTRSIPPEDMSTVLALELANTPLLEVTKMAKVQNVLSPNPAQQRNTLPAASRLIVPYFYLVHPLPLSLLHSVLLLPSILTRYDQLLLAQACNVDLFSGQIDTDLVLEALTSPSAGSGFDYERLEFLGDTFLKLVATCHTFTTHLSRTEAELHLANKGILTNVRLLSEAKRLRLDKYGLFAGSRMVAKRFVGPMVGGVGGRLVDRGMVVVDDVEVGKEFEVDRIKEKTLADITEALIGAALLTSGTQCALSICRRFHLIPHTILTLSDFNTLLLDLKSQSVVESWQSRVSLSALHHLQHLFSHEYRYPHLGLEAFTHPSLLASVLPSYQRLEFLGDAWLDFHIVMRIYGQNEQLSPGELTALKGLLASNSTLSALGHRLGLDKYVASNSAVLCDTIRNYADSLDSIVKSLDKNKDGAEEEQGQYWHDLPSHVIVPKAIADVVEASFASIVVDSEFDEETTQRVFDRIFVPFYDTYCRFDAVRVRDVKRMVEYLFGIVRRGVVVGSLGMSFGRVCTNLMELGLELEGEEGEECLVRAMLSEIIVELKVGDMVVGRCEVLPKSPTHLGRAVGIVKEIEKLQHWFCSSSFFTASSLLAAVGKDDDDDDDDHDDMEPDEQATRSEIDQVQHDQNQLEETESSKDKPICTTLLSSEATNLVDQLDKHQHLILELIRTLGWKSIFQSLNTSSLINHDDGDGDGDGDRGYSLGQLRRLIWHQE
ncbi:related to cell cycle control protein dicer [Ustilago trichophora]|uniref:Related to cell cycle control protein dicer n=1 Tax=Ustilago trichophora TaxID=86804 RepID=A0A5C3EQA4_9BASI|nr:related to cell cycle control protein dicer [Ustilago trichophora]